MVASVARAGSRGSSSTAPASPVAAATTASVLHTVPAAEVSGSRPSTGVWASHDSGPMTSRIRPSETFRNARTTRGSN